MPALGRDLPPDGPHTREQHAALLLVHERNQRVAELDGQRVDADGRLDGFGRRRRRLFFVLCGPRLVLAMAQ